MKRFTGSLLGCPAVVMTYHFCITWQSPYSFSSVERSFITESELQHILLLEKFLKQHKHSPLLASLVPLISDETSHQKLLRVPSITECSYWQSRNVLTPRAFTWWVMVCDLGFGMFMFCFFNCCFALDKNWHTAILSLCWVAWQVNPLGVQRDSETVAAVITGLARKYTLSILVTDFGLKLYYGLLGFCVMKKSIFLVSLNLSSMLQALPCVLACLLAWMKFSDWS